MIVYTDAQAELYNLKQIERLLKEEGTNSTLNGAVLISDWAPTGRADDKPIQRSVIKLNKLLLRMRVR